MIRVLLVLGCLLASLLPHGSIAETLEVPLAISSWANPYAVESAGFVLEVPSVAITEVALRLECACHRGDLGVAQRAVPLNVAGQEPAP